MSNFLQKIFKIIRFEVRTTENIANFAPIFPKMAKKYIIIFNIKSPKIAQSFYF
jgi:hypothetical protein